MNEGKRVPVPFSGQRQQQRLVSRVGQAWLVGVVSLVATAHFTWQHFQYGSGLPQHSIAASDNFAEAFSWSNIVPSEKLEYHACYGDLQCARLLVPLDYNDPDPVAQIALAVIRRPAKVPLTSSKYGGAVIINPGGPGGSGVAQQLTMGAYIQQVVDAGDGPERADSKGKFFDIISFDPRGVNHTTPTIACFPDNASRQRWDLQTTAEGLLGSSTGSLRSKWRRARAIAEGCSARLGQLAEHVNTVPVARDIVSIIERHGEWRESHVKKLLHRNCPNAEETDVFKRLSWKRGNEPLLYWGFSYGTLLGSTFASMFPSRVERMALDGVVDADDYYSGSWMKNLEDTDKILANFYRYCSDAGPADCPLWRPDGPLAIQKTHDHLLSAIRDDPLSVPGTSKRGPELITWTDIKLLVAYSVYSPLQFFPLLAELLEDLTHGNGSQFADYKTGNQLQLCTDRREPAGETCEVPFSHACVLPGWSPYDVSSAVLCTDAAPENVQFDESTFADYWATLQNQSSSMGDFWAQTRLSCAGWTARAKWRAQTPIGSGGNATRHGILFIGNTYDPVTPLMNARRMAERFQGASLLQQDSEGHGSFSEPSTCTAKTIRRYFQTGEPAEAGLVCQPDRRPFLGRVKVGMDREQEEDGNEDIEMLLRGANEAFDPLAGMRLRIL